VRVKLHKKRPVCNMGWLLSLFHQGITYVIKDQDEHYIRRRHVILIFIFKNGEIPLKLRYHPIIQNGCSSHGVLTINSLLYT